MMKIKAFSQNIRGSLSIHLPENIQSGMFIHSFFFSVHCNWSWHLSNTLASLNSPIRPRTYARLPIWTGNAGDVCLICKSNIHCMISVPLLWIHVWDRPRWVLAIQIQPLLLVHKFFIINFQGHVRSFLCWFSWFKIRKFHPSLPSTMEKLTCSLPLPGPPVSNRYAHTSQFLDL